MQKFTRALTREIELAGQRLKVTLDEKAIAVSPVGSRRPPREISWETLVCQLTGTEDIAKAVESLRSGTPSKPKPAVAKPPAPSAIPVAELLARLEKWLTQHRPRYARGLRPGATEDDFVALRGSLNEPVPEDLRQLLAWHNGQGDDFAGAFEDNWSLMSTAEIADAKRDLDAQAGDGQTGWQPAWIPILDDDSGNYLCLDPTLPGVPLREFRSTSPEAPTVAPSLGAWLVDFVQAVEGGQYAEDSERGQFIRKSS